MEDVLADFGITMDDFDKLHFGWKPTMNTGRPSAKQRWGHFATFKDNNQFVVSSR
jgi:hypothetical protein